MNSNPECINCLLRMQNGIYIDVNMWLAEYSIEIEINVFHNAMGWMHLVIVSLSEYIKDLRFHRKVCLPACLHVHPMPAT